jgi:hypothetical protein
MLIWMQILDQIEKEKWKRVAFVTADEKTDWWRKDNGRILGPSRELVREVGKLGATFFLYSVDQFLEIANEKLGLNLPDESIDQAKEIKIPSVAVPARAKNTLVYFDFQFRFEPHLIHAGEKSRLVFDFANTTDREVIVKSYKINEFAKHPWLFKVDSDSNVDHFWGEVEPISYYHLSVGANELNIEVEYFFQDNPQVNLLNSAVGYLYILENRSE